MRSIEFTSAILLLLLILCCSSTSGQIPLHHFVVREQAGESPNNLHRLPQQLTPAGQAVYIPSEQHQGVHPGSVQHVTSPQKLYLPTAPQHQQQQPQRVVQEQQALHHYPGLASQQPGITTGTGLPWQYYYVGNPNNYTPSQSILPYPYVGGQYMSASPYTTVGFMPPAQYGYALPQPPQTGLNLGGGGPSVIINPGALPPSPSVQGLGGSSVPVRQPLTDREPHHPPPTKTTDSLVHPEPVHEEDDHDEDGGLEFDALLAGLKHQANHAGQTMHTESYSWGRDLPASYRAQSGNRRGAHHRIKNPLKVEKPEHFEIYHYY